MNDKDKSRTLVGVNQSWRTFEDDEGYTVERDVGPFRLVVRQRETQEVEGSVSHESIYLHWAWYLMAYTRMAFSEKGEVLEQDSVSVLEGHAIDREIAMSVGLGAARAYLAENTQVDPLSEWPPKD